MRGIYAFGIFIYWEKYGGNKMYFAPPINYDKVMKKIPYGKVITVGKIRDFLRKRVVLILQNL